jgi:hypothetical protein
MQRLAGQTDSEISACSETSINDPCKFIQNTPEVDSCYRSRDIAILVNTSHQGPVRTLGLGGGVWRVAVARRVAVATGFLQYIQDCEYPKPTTFLTV